MKTDHPDRPPRQSTRRHFVSGLAMAAAAKALVIAQHASRARHAGGDALHAVIGDSTEAPFRLGIRKSL
jgi:hypothetical protein